MPTSELSDALNPYVTQSRLRSNSSQYLAPLQPVVQPPQQYVPHRSELELAISEPQPPPPPPTTVKIRQPSGGGVHAVQELLRIVVATREAQEIERKRRLAWEQEQEAKYIQRQAEMERRLFEMRQEIAALRTLANVNQSISSGLLTPHYSMSPAIPERRPPRPASPISPISQPAPTQPLFLQGSSRHSLHAHPTSYNGPCHGVGTVPEQEPEATIVEPPAHSVTPAPSPQHTSVEPSHSGVSVSPVNRRKRQTSHLSSDDEENSNRSDSSNSPQSRPLKRVNHHDKRCLTIHHAIRAHILLLMNLKDDRHLPDSHTEGVPLQMDEPIRFVWDKTAKQSVHNARMKARLLEDIKSNRRLYKYVPDKEFGKKTLDAAFDQSFVTLRQKFKAQRDSATALTYKMREDTKAQKARHISRRKTKLSNRAEARMNIAAFEHVTFDGALQIECMSSEESDFELDPSSTPRPPGLLRTRGYMWRSTRLSRFYLTLDEEEKTEKSMKPKRGVGKKERWTGPPKDGFHLPPKGVATWMISRRWIKETQIKHPDLSDVLKKLVHDPPGFDWGQFHTLGDTTDSDLDELHARESEGVLHQQHTSSLNYALV